MMGATMRKEGREEGEEEEMEAETTLVLCCVVDSTRRMTEQSKRTGNPGG